MKKKNNDFNKLYDSTKKVSDLANSHAEGGKVDIRNATLKVMEESGELAAEVLKYVGHKVTTETKKQIYKKLKSEGVDSFLAILDVLNIAGVSKEDILILSDKAINKWKKKHIKPKIKKKQSHVKV